METVIRPGPVAFRSEPPLLVVIGADMAPHAGGFDCRSGSMLAEIVRAARLARMELCFLRKSGQDVPKWGYSVRPRVSEIVVDQPGGHCFASDEFRSVHTVLGHPELIFCAPRGSDLLASSVREAMLRRVPHRMIVLPGAMHPCSARFAKNPACSALDVGAHLSYLFGTDKLVRVWGADRGVDLTGSDGG